MFAGQSSQGRGRNRREQTGQLSSLGSAALAHATQRLSTEEKARYDELRRMLRSFEGLRSGAENVFEEEVKPLCDEVEALEDKMRLKKFARFDCAIFKYNLDRASDYMVEAKQVMPADRRLIVDDLEDMMAKRRRNKLPTATIESIRKFLQL